MKRPVLILIVTLTFTLIGAGLGITGIMMLSSQMHEEELLVCLFVPPLVACVLGFIISTVAAAFWRDDRRHNAARICRPPSPS